MAANGTARGAGSARDRGRAIAILNLAFGLASLMAGGWLLWHLVPMLASPENLEAVLLILPDKHPGLSPAAKSAVFAGLAALAVAFIAWGIRSLLRPRKKATAYVNVLLAIQALLALALIEAGLRTAVALDIGPFAGPSYLANPACGDLYYRLAHDPRAEAYSQQLAYDAEIGWIRPSSADNPEGLAWPPAIDTRPKTWFFGDSFMAGVRAAHESIPARYEKLRPATQALNYGVGGYGLDQIWLRYRRASDAIPAGARVVVGVLTTDLDRSVLSYFGGFKPRFVADGSGYRLVPPPPRESLPARFAALATDVPSYAFAGLQAVRELLETGFDRSEVACDRSEKEAVNAYLIDAVVARARARRHKLEWVLFVPFSDFYKPRSWRYDFLRDAFAARGQRYLDTMQVLRAAATAAGRPPESYYIPADGHLTAEGNAAVAAALAALPDRAPDTAPGGG